MNKIRMFIKWKSTNDNLKLHDDLLSSLTREQFNNFKHEDMRKVFNMSAPSHIEPNTHMTTFTGHTKSSATSESQSALNNFKRIQKGMHQHIPSSRIMFTMIHFRDHF